MKAGEPQARGLCVTQRTQSAGEFPNVREAAGDRRAIDKQSANGPLCDPLAPGSRIAKRNLSALGDVRLAGDRAGAGEGTPPNLTQKPARCTE